MRYACESSAVGKAVLISTQSFKKKKGKIRYLFTATDTHLPAHVYCSNLYPQYIISSCLSVRFSRSLRAASVSTSLM